MTLEGRELSQPEIVAGDDILALGKSLESALGARWWLTAVSFDTSKLNDKICFRSDTQDDSGVRNATPLINRL